MGFKIRKSIKIAPGIKLNLSKSGISTSIGKAGATINISKRGVKSTVGIPGTGISHTQSHFKTQDDTASAGLPRWVIICAIVFVVWLVWAAV